MQIPEYADVVVVGAGNAALCSALSAAEQGASVLVVERTSRADRGGNGIFTGGFMRFAFDGIDDLRAVADLSAAEEQNLAVGQYTPEAFFVDVAEVTDYRADPDLVEALTTRSNATVRWLKSVGVRFLPALGLHPADDDGRVPMLGHAPAVEVSGGGAGLIDALYRRVDAVGLPVLYRTRATSLVTNDVGDVVGVRVRHDRTEYVIGAKAVILASGGFEASAELRARYLGSNWDLARVRGASSNTGDGIRMALDIGGQAFGNWSGCHSAPVDVNSPAFGDPNLTDAFTRRSYHLGIMVNREGRRFLDEGADFEARTYSFYGKEILQQPGQVAYQIFDAAALPHLRPEYALRQGTRIQKDTIAALADAAAINPDQLRSTVAEFNAATGDAPFDPRVKDGKSTGSLHPPKSNWATPIITPPFTAFPVTCGITFTYGGVRINSDAQVMHEDGYPVTGLFAAGEMVGGLFWGNYPTGGGVISGAVFGRTAGTHAGRLAAHSETQSSAQ
ncbi:FAD-dependent tricarballylate dehydrogenase TcuA [uncultured Jatrophihabitans sp.]|uniref:FAD-dependent tricarballylate dehydrogenase TcuA n=1 Tax=uncultured Jatrophihabitans sp. TaxID=1610747 RepID=UPI0035C9CDFD